MTNKQKANEVTGMAEDRGLRDKSVEEFSLERGTCDVCSNIHIREVNCRGWTPEALSADAPSPSEPQERDQLPVGREPHKCPDCEGECFCFYQKGHCWHECPDCDCGHELESHSMEPDGAGHQECGECICIKYRAAAPAGPTAAGGEESKPLSPTAYTLGRAHTCPKCEHSNIPCPENRRAAPVASQAPAWHYVYDYAQTHDHMTIHGATVQHIIDDLRTALGRIREARSIIEQYVPMVRNILGGSPVRNVSELEGQALIAAEIDRLQRKSEPEEDTHGK